MTISQYSHLSCTVLYLTLSYDSLEVLRYSEGMFDLPSVFIVFSVSTQSFSWSHVSTHYYLFFCYVLFFPQFYSIFSPTVPLLHFPLWVFFPPFLFLFTVLLFLTPITITLFQTQCFVLLLSCRLPGLQAKSIACICVISGRKLECSGVEKRVLF